MNDIVVRLRNLGWPTCHEAADEIERLRVENKRLRGWIAPDIIELTDEIERLRASLAEWKALAIQWAKDNDPRALEPKP